MCSIICCNNSIIHCHFTRTVHTRWGLLSVLVFCVRAVGLLYVPYTHVCADMFTVGNTQPTPSLVSTPSNSQPPTATSHQQSSEHTPGIDGPKGGGVSNLYWDSSGCIHVGIDYMILSQVPHSPQLPNLIHQLSHQLKNKHEVGRTTWQLLVDFIHVHVH